MMEDDATSTTTMTSVTDELSVDDLEVTENDLEMSSQITTSDANEEGNTTMVNTPLLQMHGKHVDSNNAVSDVSMGEDSGKGNSKTTTEEQNSNSQPRKDQLPKLSGPGHSDAGDPPEKGIQFPNLLSMPDNWYEHHCFDRYWRHYQFVSMWCQKHMQVYRTVWQQYKKMADQLEAARRAHKPHSHSQSDGHVFKKPTSSRTIRNRKARRRRKAAKKRMRMALKNAEMAGSGSSFSQSSDEGQKSEADKGGETTESAVEGMEEEEEEEMQMEISEEMLDFFAHTHKHRQERDALKKNKKSGKEEKHVNIEEVRGDQKERTAAAPTERPGSKRTSEMRLLYGKGAAMIHGMETALQMNFDRNLDVLQPSLWPNMPFRVIFD